MHDFDYDLSWKQWEDMKKYGPMSRHVRRLILNSIRDLDFRSVLDIGCGEGSLLKNIPSIKSGVKICGADISEQAIERARTKVKGEFHVLDVEKGHLDEKFDLVVCSEILEHIPDDGAAVRNINHMAGKYLLIVVPQGRMREFEKSVGHVRNYSRQVLNRLLCDNGFEVLKMKEWGFPLYSPIYRSLLNHFPQQQKATTGEYGLFRRAVSQFLYYLFFLTVPNTGDVLIALASSTGSAFSGKQK